MESFKISDMKGGWFVGNFTPTTFKTSACEVGYKVVKKDEAKPDIHYHKIATEITYVIRGKIQIQDKVFSEGEVFILQPYEIADPIILEDCEFIVVKLPGALNDKYSLEAKDANIQK